MDITSDRKILDMVEHCHPEFTENPYQQYPKPPIKFNSDKAAIIDGKTQQLLSTVKFSTLDLIAFHS